MDHKELVQRANKWLKNTKKCGVILIEWYGGPRETPDAIGWVKGKNSILIECKTTLNDFKADSKKYFRKRSGYGMGRERYYMTPPNLIELEDLPKGWGLLEVYEKKVSVKKKSDINDLTISSLKNENKILIHALRCITCEIEQENKDLSWFKYSNHKKREESIKKYPKNKD